MSALDSALAHYEAIVEDTAVNARAELTALREKAATLGAVTKVLRDMVRYLYAAHYADNGVPVQPLDDAEGLLLQVSNMCSGLTRKTNGDAGPETFATEVSLAKHILNARKGAK